METATLVPPPPEPEAPPPEPEAAAAPPALAPPALAPPPAPAAAPPPARAAAPPPRPHKRAQAEPARVEPPRAASKPAPRLARHPPESATPTRTAARPAPPTPQTAGDGGAAEIAAFRSLVARRIASEKRYPAGARERGERGRPVVAFNLSPSGGLAGVSLARSSGHAELDAEILAMVRRAAPFPKPPPGAARAFSLAVSFDLR
ncbi:MAG: energy transducer TonB [Rhizobiales bacterium]|nr:energy transducer TonB [Hyphomicrobiales bacterium]